MRPGYQARDTNRNISEIVYEIRERPAKCRKAEIHTSREAVNNETPDKHQTAQQQQEQEGEEEEKEGKTCKKVCTLNLVGRSRRLRGQRVLPGT